MSDSNIVSKSAMTGLSIIGKVSSFLGWPLAAVFGLFAVVGLFVDTKDKMQAVIFFLIVAGIGFILIKQGKRIKQTLRRFNQYSEMIPDQEEVSVERIATTVGQPIEVVMKDLQDMVARKVLTKGYVDVNRRYLVFRQPDGSSLTKPMVETKTVSCKGCGASNAVPVGGSGQCEYCGSPLSTR